LSHGQLDYEEDPDIRISSSGN